MCAPLWSNANIFMCHFRKRCAMAHMAHARIIPACACTLRWDTRTVHVHVCISYLNPRYRGLCQGLFNIWHCASICFMLNTTRHISVGLGTVHCLLCLWHSGLHDLLCAVSVLFLFYVFVCCYSRAVDTFVLKLDTMREFFAPLRSAKYSERWVQISQVSHPFSCTR